MSEQKKLNESRRQLLKNIGLTAAAGAIAAGTTTAVQAAAKSEEKKKKLKQKVITKLSIFVITTIPCNRRSTQ